MKGVAVLWKRSPIQPVPPWADTCSLQISEKCKAHFGRINEVSARVSYVNAKLLGPCKVRYRKTVKMKHICRDCREALRPLQKDRRERWKRLQKMQSELWKQLTASPANPLDAREGE